MNIGDAVELVKDLPEKKLYSGMQGTIVDCHSDAYEIEFTTPDGETIDFLSLTPENFILTWTIENKKFVSAKGDFETYLGTSDNFRGKIFTHVKPVEPPISDVFIYYSGHGAVGVQSKKGFLVLDLISIVNNYNATLFLIPERTCIIDILMIFIHYNE
jgi:hypothetical protein